MVSYSRIFVSLGDNCEFGFVQRALGYESGGLLRWAITRPAPLLNLIQTDFENLYQLENLTPSSPDMVCDNATGIFFHSEMRSQNGNFIHSDGERAQIYDGERGKLDHLVNKLRDQLSQKHCFVYKQNSGLQDVEMDALAQAIKGKGQGHLLCVTDQGADAPGHVRHVKDNLYIGRIDRFAAYETADDISLSVWTDILENYLKLAQ